MSAVAANSRIHVLRLGLDGTANHACVRDVPIEAAVALEYCGIGHAVMMASPTDLEDFCVGHAIAEGLVLRASDVTGISAAPVAGGWVVRADLPAAARAAIYARARSRISDSSCGLCGVESIAAALRPLPRVGATVYTSRTAISRALAALGDHQPLNRATGGVHAAAFCSPEGDIICVREDVGRHTALDKLIGALGRDGVDMRLGFVLLSARCSFELVEKTVRSGAPILVTLSAPTSLAAERAEAAGLTLLALARTDSVLVVHDPAGSIS